MMDKQTQLMEEMWDMLTDIECLGYLTPAPEDTKSHKELCKEYSKLRKKVHDFHPNHGS